METKPPDTPIGKIPVEILQMIVENISLAERSSFAMTCKYYYIVLAPHTFWRHISLLRSITCLVHVYDREEARQFLQLLERDFGDEDYACSICLIIHTNTGSTKRRLQSYHRHCHLHGGYHSQQSTSRLKVKSIFPNFIKSASRFQFISDTKARFARYEAHSHFLSLQQIQSAVMGSDVNNQQDRLKSIHELACADFLSYRFADNSDIVMRYVMIPCVIQWANTKYLFVHRVMLFLARKVPTDSLAGFMRKIEMMNIPICLHLSTFRPTERTQTGFAHQLINATRLYHPMFNHGGPIPTRRCPFCATEFRSSYHNTKNTTKNPDGLRIMTISIWQNLGQGLKWDDPYWLSVVRPHKTKPHQVFQLPLFNNTRIPVHVWDLHLTQLEMS